MPYTSNQELPDQVKHHLPQEAQTIYRKAFNSAHEQYGDDGQAAAVAWSAVKQSYEKNEHDEWVKK